MISTSYMPRYRCKPVIGTVEVAPIAANITNAVNIPKVKGFFHSNPIERVQTQEVLDFQLQERKHFLGWTYWTDVVNSNNEPIKGDFSDLSKKIEHLSDYRYISE